MITKWIAFAAVVFPLTFRAGAAVDFATQVEPIFESKCFECHSPIKGKPKAGLRLDIAEGITRGSKEHKVVTPGKPDESLMLHVVSLPADDLDLMPPSGKGTPLTKDQLDLIRAWIAEGCNFGSWTAHKFDVLSAPIPAVKPAAPANESAPAIPAYTSPVKTEFKPPVKSPFAPLKTVEGAAGQIDQLVEANCQANNIRPNPPADHATFVRRIYLDAVGRIPTYDETREFFESPSANKRAELINRLLASDGYVSRQYDFWADLLRIESRMRQGVDGGNYQEWVKNAIRHETPYNKFVDALLTAEGHIYENGASGYYLRDNGMPLDNMANTVQIFLGTRLTCAQCHNHPFDHWTQKEFYEMSAFTFGVQTVRPATREDREKARELMAMDVDNKTKQAIKGIVRKTRYGYVSDTPGKQIRLPDNYKYPDAAPNAKVDPKAIFGGPDSVAPADRRHAYSAWLTSTENPRFTTVIANRLWKQAMGRGLIEPVDDMKDDTVPSNPELMAYLADLMKSLDYNQKSFLRILYNTKTYQRQASLPPESADEIYRFPGPLARRMSAEQIWDSVMTLIVPNLDQREGQVRRRGVGDSVEELEKIRQMSPQELVAMVQNQMERRAEKNPEGKAGKPVKKLSEADVPETGMIKLASGPASGPAPSQIVLTAGGKGKALARARAKAMAEKKRAEASTKEREEAKSEMAKREEAKAEMAKRAAPAKAKPQPRREAAFPAGMVRASEVQQPAPPGHFLQQFGASDRETIDAGNTTATVPQVLTLLNGPAYAELAKPGSVLSQTLKNAGSSPDAQAEAIFLSIYNRRPTEPEARAARQVIASDPQGVQDLVWALLNTQQFMFIR